MTACQEPEPATAVKYRIARPVMSVWNACFDGGAVLIGPAPEPERLDLLALGQDVLDELGVLVAEVGADGVEARVGQALQEGLARGLPVHARTLPCAS